MKTLATVACSLVLLSAAHARAEDRAPRAFDISPQNLSTALSEFARQSRQDVFFAPEVVADKLSGGVRGHLPPLAALQEVLKDSGLAFSTTPKGVILVWAPSDSTAGGEGRQGELKLAQADQAMQKVEGEAKTSAPVGAASKEAQNASDSSRDNESESSDSKGIPEVLVKGSKSLNMDIRRTRDDPQPYVVFDRETIERSGSRNIEEVLKTRLPMNAVMQGSNQSASTLGAHSQINLRGLGTSQTLVLVDGHRVGGTASFQTPTQPDLNGIPIGAIERIEVLPTTASGIYGGSATGGVVNIVLRRAYSGMDVNLTYDNTFRADSAMRRVDLNSGFMLEGGKTAIMIAASYSDANDLLVRDRDFVQRGRAAILVNNPSFYLNSSTPLFGATPNIRSVSGANLVLKNGTTLNSPITYVPVGYVGTSSDNGAALVNNAGKYNFDLAGSTHTQGGRLGLLNSPTVESLIVTARRQWTPGLETFLEVAGSNNIGHFPANLAFFPSTYRIPASAPNNPFMQDINVAVPFDSADSDAQSTNQDRRVVAGLVAKLAKGWQAGFDYMHDRGTRKWSGPLGLSAQAASAIATGAPDVLRDVRLYPADLSGYLQAYSYTVTPFQTTLQDQTLRVSGPFGSLPGGAPTASIMLERQTVEFDESNQFNFGSTIVTPSMNQSINSAYAEVRLPIMPAESGMRALRALELQVAVRHDAYTTEGAGFLSNPTPSTPIVRGRNSSSSTNPTIALRFQPVSGVTIRGSYGTGFLPPGVDQVAANAPQPNSQSNLIDPRRGNSTIPVGQFTSTTGGSAALEPEKSESWSVGAVFSPEAFARGLRLAVDYTNIEKRDNIVQLQSQQTIDNEALLPDRIVRGPNLATDPPTWAGPITLIDGTLINIARAQITAYDVSLEYERATRGKGRFDFFLAGTWMTHYKKQLLPNAPIVESVGISAGEVTGSSNPVKLKVNAGITWSQSPYTLAWSAHYFDSYFVANPISTPSSVLFNNQGAQKVRSQLYHDIFGSYQFAAESRLLRDMEIRFGVRNVLNTKPPFDASASLLYSPFADPRQASYYVSIRRQF